MVSKSDNQYPVGFVHRRGIRVHLRETGGALELYGGRMPAPVSDDIRYAVLLDWMESDPQPSKALLAEKYEISGDTVSSIIDEPVIEAIHHIKRQVRLGRDINVALIRKVAMLNILEMLRDKDKDITKAVLTRRLKFALEDEEEKETSEEEVQAKAFGRIFG